MLEVSVSGSRGDQAVEARLAPGHEPFRRLLPHDLAKFLRVVARLLKRLAVFGLVIGGLNDDGAGGVVACPPGPAGNLVELAGVQLAHPDAVVLGERGQQDGADGNVDADAEGVGAADHAEQPALGKLFHQPAVLGQHPGVVNADAGTDQPRQGAAEVRGETEVTDQFGDLVTLRPADHLDARHRLGPLQRGELREVHDVDGSLVGGEQVLDRLVHRRDRVVEVQRHRPFDAGDHRGLPPGAAG